MNIPIFSTANNRSRQIIIATISGAGIGCLLLGGLWVFNQSQSLLVKSNTSSRPTTTGISVDEMLKSYPAASPAASINAAIPQPSKSPGNVVTESLSSFPRSSIGATNAGSISREAGLDVLKRWLEYKRVLLAPPYNTQPASTILTEKAYTDNIDKSSLPCGSSGSDDCLSSVQWLKRYNAYYSFSSQKIESLDSFETNGDRASISVTITEYRILHQSGKSNVSSGGTKKARYDLKSENGQVKISGYKVF
jgi:ARC6-like, IMS domain